MNKLTKGAIAGAAGLTLLLGGGTTFALWNSSAEVSGGTIVAGNLAVAPSMVDGVEAVGTWIVKDGTAAGRAIPVLSNFTASPGDVLVYTKSMHITASGDNLVAELALAPGSIVASETSVPADVNLAEYLVGTAVLTADGTGISDNYFEAYRMVTTGPTKYVVTPGTGVVDEDVTVEVTITFPNGALGLENTMMLGSVALQDMAVTLTQQ
ncbi:MULTISPECIES: alternate-type signal peptide domain-containing protein [Cryobacterium]|jgi:alternate signal-mediated exported protein|uniref:Alternate-type signal peptide domain-containing protein n=1 Tax=Cryobacterium lyxosi TaxID=1259228 RepID=A0A4R8ZHT3_9MICO|nr:MULTISPECIES: alternate-type signal peptide domain-containing protein [Cryobacterium]TFD26556.1 alternate-type signal peptide domain-containing protein [Cryobacterium lyxosi]